MRVHGLHGVPVVLPDNVFYIYSNALIEWSISCPYGVAPYQIHFLHHNFSVRVLLAINSTGIQSRDIGLSPQSKIMSKVVRSSENDHFEVRAVVKNMNFHWFSFNFNRVDPIENRGKSMFFTTPPTSKWPFSELRRTLDIIFGCGDSPISLLWIPVLFIVNRTRTEKLWWRKCIW